MTLTLSTPSTTPSTRSTAERGVRRTAKRTLVRLKFSEGGPPEAGRHGHADHRDESTSRGRSAPGRGLLVRVGDLSVGVRTLPEERATDPDDRGPLLDRELEVVAHPHRQLGAELKFKPLWIEDLISLAHSLLKVTH